MSISRITAMSDGVFAIAITLLVFNIKLPELPADHVRHDLPPIVKGLGPYLLSYVLSFAMIGVYWVGHHNIFHHIRRSNRVLLWLNLLFLMCVAFLPYPAALLGRYPHERIPLIVYGLTLICTGLSLQLLWWYAAVWAKLIPAKPSRFLIRQASFKILAVPAISLLSIGISFINPMASVWIYLMVPLIYVLPNRLDRQWVDVNEKRDLSVPADCHADPAELEAMLAEAEQNSAEVMAGHSDDRSASAAGHGRGG
jgi:uncharacterized membrane protein